MEWCLGRFERSPRPLDRILGFLVRGLILLGNALTPGRGYREGPFATEAELRALVDVAEQNSEIEAAERRRQKCRPRGCEGTSASHQR